MTVYTGDQERFHFLVNPCTNPGAVGQWQQYGVPQSVTRNPSVTKGSNYQDWRTRLRQGKQCTTSLTGLKYIETHTDGLIETILNSTGCETVAIRNKYHRGDLLKPQVRYEADFIPPSAIVTSSDDSAKRCVVNKLSGDFSTGVFVGELGQTLRLIRDPAKSIRKAIDDYVHHARGLRGKSKSILRGIADAWLTTAFGIKPLMSDIENANRALEKIKKREGSRKHFYCVGSDSLTGSLEGPFNAQLSGFNISYWFRRDYHQTTVYRGLMRLESDSTITLARHLLGIDPRRFVPDVYNLIPYSFLVDYFTNIGDIINAWSQGSGKLRWAAKTTISEMSIHLGRSIRCEPSAYYSSYRVLAHPYNHWTVRKVARAPYTGNFIPNFRWEVPGIGSTKWLNIAALAGLRVL